jgi:hypothetical protein
MFPNKDYGAIVRHQANACTYYAGVREYVNPVQVRATSTEQRAHHAMIVQTF